MTRFATGFVKSHESAEEIYCDVLMKLWDLGPALNTVENLKLYLYTSVKNASLNYLAKYHKVQFIDIDSVDIDFRVTVGASSDKILQSEFQRHASLAIKALPPQCRLVFQLIREDNFTYKEVANMLNISVKTVEGHMKTALFRLKTSLSFYLRPDSN